MRLLRQVGLAAVLGAVAELILLTPLLLVSGHLGVGPLPLWVSVLQTFQMPGTLIAEHLVRTEAAKLLATHSPRHWVAYLQSLAMLIQATIFALVAFSVVHFCGLRTAKVRRDLPPRRSQGASVHDC
jgi:hypothetical protein